jgi:exopolysaccharide production protein ExoZ
LILSVQYMRTFAALLVVLSHVAMKGAQYSTDPLSFFNVGAAGVDLFFIISGYIMCHTVSGKSVVFVEFLWAKAKRIIPLYWILTSAALVIFMLFPDKVNSSGGATNIVYSYLLFPTPEKYLIQNGWT